MSPIVFRRMRARCPTCEETAETDKFGDLKRAEKVKLSSRTDTWGKGKEGLAELFPTIMPGNWRKQIGFIEWRGPGSMAGFDERRRENFGGVENFLVVIFKLT